MGFLQSCFSLLFGDPDPNRSPVSYLHRAALTLTLALTLTPTLTPTLTR